MEGITPKIRMLSFVLINSVILKLLSVWIQPNKDHPKALFVSLKSRFCRYRQRLYCWEGGGRFWFWFRTLQGPLQVIFATDQGQRIAYCCCCFLNVWIIDLLMYKRLFLNCSLFRVYSEWTFLNMQLYKYARCDKHS